jgi:hypothetical protein
MITRSSRIAELFAVDSPISPEGQTGWGKLMQKFAGVRDWDLNPRSTEYFSPAQFELLQSNRAAAGGEIPIVIRDAAGNTRQVTASELRALIGDSKVGVIAEVAAPAENQVGFASPVISPTHQEEPIVGSIPADGILQLTIIWDGRLPPVAGQ